ncbi:MAG: TetR/AcrR family transcriptional regulator [Myxococcota bacterium]
MHASTVKVRGRPRNEERRAAILQAARELVLEVGYTRVTIDAVARRSGASRTTIYQWWGHRAPLVEEAIFADYGDWPIPDTGSFEGDVAQLVEELVREMTRPHVARAFPALQAEFQADPDLKAGLRARYGDPMVARWRKVFEGAEERGELPAGSHAEAALQLALGAILMMTQSSVLPRRRLVPYLCTVLSIGLPAAEAGASPIRSRAGPRGARPGSGRLPPPSPS